MSKPGFFSFSGTRRRTYAGPLGPYIDDFIESLQQRGYERPSIRFKILSVADCSRWFSRRGQPLTAWDSEVVSRFIAYRKRSRRYNWDNNSAVRQMIERLRAQHVIPTVTPPDRRSEREAAEDEFCRYLLERRGLSTSNLQCYQRCVSRFLRVCFADGPLRFDRLRPAEVIDFIQHNTRRFSFSRGQQTATAIRAFLKYLLQRGKIAIDLGDVVPRLGHWYLAKLPFYLRAEQIAEILKQTDRTTVSGRRDYAILLHQGAGLLPRRGANRIRRAIGEPPNPECVLDHRPPCS